MIVSQNGNQQHFPMVELNGDGRVVTGETSPIITVQPRPSHQMSFTSISNGCQMLSTDCLAMLNSPCTCKVATGILACGAMGASMGLGMASLVGMPMAKSALIGYMVGTASGAIGGCVVQKAHDMHWQEETNEAVEGAINAMTIPADAPRGEDAGIDNPAYEAESEQEKEENATALAKNVQLDRYYE